MEFEINIVACQAVEKKQSLQISEHLCFKNWSAPSTAMEADIIVERFKQSVPMHNLIYSQLTKSFL